MNSKLSLLFLVVFAVATAQEKNLKFGKVSADEVMQKAHTLEPETDAAILYKKERVYYNFSAATGFSTIREAHYRIKIYSKAGLDWGTLEVPLYTSKNGEERISSIKGYTYNMVDGKLQATKLKKDGIFKENVNRYRNKASIAMPDVREGSVVEVEYKIASDLAGNLDEFQFQYGIPVDEVDVTVEIPEYFFFKRYGKGFYPIDVQQTRKNRKMTVQYREENDPGRLNGGSRRSNLEFYDNVYKVNTKNVPSLKEVDYTDNIDNYRSAIKFELASTQFPNTPYKNYSLTWDDVAASIYNYEDFGGEIAKSRLVKDIVDNITSEVSGKSQQLEKIYQYVKDNITWNEYYGMLCENGIKKALQDKTGNVADINLTLVAMLQYAGFNAQPVLVSTKSHGIPLFPTREGFNYVICAVDMDGDKVLLDASEKMGSVGVLPIRAMNWKGRLIRKDGTSMEIDLASTKKAKHLVFMNANILEDGAVEGKMRTQLTSNSAFYYRKSHKDESWEDIMNAMEQRYVEMEVDGLELKNEKDCHKPVVESCSFVKENQLEMISGKLFFKPALFLATTENPFKMDRRDYPVDFGYPASNQITINFNIPEGYIVESVPDNMSIGLPDGLGTFKYSILAQGNRIQFRCATDINRAIIPPNYYEALKEFYNQVVVKQTENVVLTKA